MTILPYELARTSDSLTSRGGLVVVLEMMNHLKLEPVVNRFFSSSLSPRAYGSWRYIQTLMLIFHDELPSFDHVEQLNQDPALLSVLPYGQFPKATSLGAWLRRSGQNSTDLRGVVELNRHVLSSALWKCQEVTLDINATEIVANKTSADYTYKGNKGYMPMVGHIAQTGQVVATDFRAGNCSPAKDNLAFIQQCQEALPAGVQVRQLRIDSAGYQHAILDYCQDQGIEFAIRARLHPSLRQEISELSEERWQPFEGKDDTQVARMSHCMENSEYAFDLIIERTLLPKEQHCSLPLKLELIESTDSESLTNGDQWDGFQSAQYAYQAIATNFYERTPQQVVQFYHQRAEDSENRIKELKRDFCAERLPCSDFNANALYFQLSALAYNLFALQRDVITSMNRKRVITVRRQLYDVAAKVTRHARRLVIQLRDDHVQLLTLALKQIKTIPPPLVPI